MVREHQFNTGATRPLIIGMAIIITSRSACKVKFRCTILILVKHIMCQPSQYPYFILIPGAAWVQNDPYDSGPRAGNENEEVDCRDRMTEGQKKTAQNSGSLPFISTSNSHL
jgi:hypothetical protein